ncbi:MAG: helix-turn-helix domain-containing protein [Flavobacteriaceae bacterium]|jgi:DNA-binding HxlR family transcriptional regulator|nr:helix-turn-helix domain-containing protein [Flavobacteriaceae bacterium]
MKINSLHCPVTNALTVLGGKWKINIIFLLSNKTMRFGAIKNTLQGITQQMLSKQLKELERDKLIIRTVHDTVPLKVTYKLTDLGKSSIPVLRSMHEWGIKQQSKLAKIIKLNYEVVNR